MTLRLLAASLRRRFRQLALIVAAVALAAATVAALAGLSLRAAGGGLGSELAAFGPNLVVRPQVGGPDRLPAGEVERVREVPGVETAVGVVETESGETGPGVVRVEVRARRQLLEAVAAEIERRIPGAEARPLLAVSVSEATLLARLIRLLGVFALVSSLLALISVGAATTALVEERRKEVGLLLALGYTGRRVRGLFAAELVAAALVAALVGELAGELAAGRGAASVAAVLVVGAAMTVALRRLEGLEPAAVLRGE